LRRDEGDHGLGIYLSPHFTTSISYTSPSVNGYPKSQFSHVYCIGLCEVEKVPKLKKCTETETTFQDENAIILRFIVIIPYQSQDIQMNCFPYNYTSGVVLDLEKTPITTIPTLPDILRYFSTK
jgi:hypothetical protein